MAAKVGVSFSQQFGIPSQWFKTNEVLNPTLDVDTQLFIDPLLLQYSKHQEFSECSFDIYISHFEKVFKLLSASTTPGDLPWRSAQILIQYNEISGTCLGYSKRSVRGSGFGKELSSGFMRTSKQIVDLGVKDVEFFSILSLFEEKVGADRISDMTTNIIFDRLMSFNQLVLAKIERDTGVQVPLDSFVIKAKSVKLPRNPFDNNPIPVILVPTDVLKHLPIADDIREAKKVADQNAELRERVNQHIASIWDVKLKKDKEAIKRDALESAAAFQAFLDLVKEMEKRPYDFFKDPEGLIIWRSASRNFAAINPVPLAKFSGGDRLTYINAVCVQIIDQFKHLVENQRLSKLLWVDGDPRPERFAQLLFLGIAAAYCEANDIDLSPEADAGAGPVDFKMSTGLDKVVIEIKLSRNTALISGFKKQLEAYMNAEKTHKGHFVVIDVGHLGDKMKELGRIRGKDRAFFGDREIHLIDGHVRDSASKLK